MTDFNINVVVNPSGAERGIKKVRGELKKTEEGADRLRNSIKRAFLFAGGTALLTGSIRLLADFSQSMSTVKAISGATEQQFKSLREEALKLGATTRFSAAQAGDAMLFLARAGFEASEVLEGVSSTLLLAQAGALDLGRAADISSNVLQGFRLEVSDLDKVVDVLTLTANSSNTNIEQMGIAMQFVAPVAAGMGVSLEEASSAIGQLSNAGLQASLAGTGLRRVLSELESPSKGTIKILQSLGVSAEEVAITQVGLTGALQRLKQAGIDTGQALELFGDRGGPAFEVLQQAIPDIIELNESLNNAEGTAKKIADTMDQNLNGALLALKSSLQNVVLQFGELGGQNNLTSFVRGMTEAMRGLANNLESVISIASGVAVALTVNFVKARLATLSAAGAMSALNLAIKANPIGLLAGGLVTLVSLSDQIKITSEGFTTLSDIASSAIDFIKRSFDGLSEIISGVFITISSLSDEAFTAMGLNAKEGFGLLSASALESFKDIDFSILGILKAAALVADRFVSVFIGVFKVILAAFKNFGRAFFEAWIDQFNRIDRFVTDSMNDLIEKINPVLSFTGLQIDQAELSQIENVYRGAGQTLGSALSDAALESANFDFFRGSLESIILGANDLSRKGVTKENKKTDTNSDTTNTSTNLPKSINDNGINPTFAALLKELNEDYRIQAEMLGKTNAEREIANELLQIESDIKRNLTPIEREQATVLLEGIQSLEAQAEIYDFLKAPQQEYMETLGAINQLLKDNKISQIEANIALQDTQLSRALTDVQGSINPEEEETRRLTEQLQERHLIVQQSIEAGLIQKEEGFLLSLELEKRHAQDVEAIQRQQASFALQSASSTFESLAGISAGFVGKQSGTYKALFAISKAFAIADATVNIQAAIAEAAKGTFPANIAQMAIVAEQTAKIISTIQGTQFEGGFASGGNFMVGGSGGTDSQSVSFMATPGERVSIETPQQQKANSNTESTNEEAGGVRILNVVDPSLVEDFMTSATGEKTLINTIQRNANSVNAALS